MRRFSLASLVAVAALIATNASPAAASMTIGQLAPGATTACDDGYDWMPWPRSSTYVVPANGTITSWSHIAAAGAGQRLTMKIWRATGVGHSGIFVLVVGHDGPRTLTEGTLNTFPASIPVEGGDILGLHSGTGGVGCLFAAPGSIVRRAFMDAADGEETKFPSTVSCPDCPPPVSDYGLNISAVVEPDCDKDGLGDETQDTNISSCSPPPSAAPTAPAARDPKCKKLGKKLKRQQKNLTEAVSEAKRAMIQANIEDTQKRLRKLGC